MSSEKSILPHHEQLPLCTTRLPYRQGRKLTAVKVYTVNGESNHLLVFGIPALNLRHEARSLFLRFGELQLFHMSSDHPGDIFTETYHVKYRMIQPARLAKRMLDTKSFFGGTLHVCYAPEFETIQETKQKLIQRKQDVNRRLHNLNKEKNLEQETSNTQEHVNDTSPLKEPNKAIDNEVLAMGDTKLDMGAENIIYLKRKLATPSNQTFRLDSGNNVIMGQATVNPYASKPLKLSKKKKKDIQKPCEEIEVIDFTKIDKEVLSNINEGLNYNKFGNEVVRSVEMKPLNRIKFNKST